jgi:hypothetical protein
MFNLEHLTEKQWALLTELVESELGALPVEIRHTHNSEMREELHERMRTAQELLERMHELSAV